MHSAEEATGRPLTPGRRARWPSQNQNSARASEWAARQSHRGASCPQAGFALSDIGDPPRSPTSLTFTHALHRRNVCYAPNMRKSSIRCSSGRHGRPPGEKRAAPRTLAWCPRRVALQISRYIELDAAMVFEHACKLGLEGIVSKRRGSWYESGRSALWLKTKNHPSASSARRRLFKTVENAVDQRHRSATEWCFNQHVERQRAALSPVPPRPPGPAGAPLCVRGLLQWPHDLGPRMGPFFS